MPSTMVLLSIAMSLAFLCGISIGLGLTWWRWKMALELEERTREWNRTAFEVQQRVAKQIRYMVKIDETMGDLARRLAIHIRVTTPEHLRGFIDKLAGSEDPEPKKKPVAGWDAPIPPFEKQSGVGATERKVRDGSARPA